MTSSKVLDDSEILVDDFSVSLSEASMSANTSLKMYLIQMNTYLEF